MGRAARLKRERREARKQALPPCSYKNCSNGRPESTHIIRKRDGNFFASCADCIEPMMQALRLAGIDAQVITHAALAMMGRGAKKRAQAKLAAGEDPECPRCGGPATPAGRGVMHDTPCPHSSHDDPVK